MIGQWYTVKHSDWNVTTWEVNGWFAFKTDANERCPAASTSDDGITIFDPRVRIIHSASGTVIWPDDGKLHTADADTLAAISRGETTILLYNLKHE